MSATSNLKFTLNKKDKQKKINNQPKYKVTLLIMKIILILAIFLSIIFSYIYFYKINKMIEDVSSTSEYEPDNVSNFFNKDSIKKIRKVSQEKDKIILPDGRRDPFEIY